MAVPIPAADGFSRREFVAASLATAADGQSRDRASASRPQRRAGVCLKRHRMVRTQAGGETEEVRGPGDTTAALALAFMNSAGVRQLAGRPIVAFLPRRLDDVEIVAGNEWQPVVTDDFVLVPLPSANREQPVTIMFRGRDDRRP